jgi:hypothetical protein
LIVEAGRDLLNVADPHKQDSKDPLFVAKVRDVVGLYLDGPPTQRRHPRLDPTLERQPATLRLEQDRRPNPGQHRQLLPTN